MSDHSVQNMCWTNLNVIAFRLQGRKSAILLKISTVIVVFKLYELN